MALLAASIFWTGGSMFMRLLFYPGYIFWFDVSIIGLFFIPVLFYNFVSDFINAKSQFLKLIYTLLTFAIVIGNLSHFFIKYPNLEITDTGKAIFTYEMGWTVMVPAIFTLIVILSIIIMIAKDVKNKSVYAGSLTPIIIGIVILFIGNIAISIPAFSASSIDRVAGIINASCILYALYKRRLFKLTLLFSRGTSYAIAISVVLMIFALFIQSLENLISQRLPQINEYATLIIATSFTVFTIIIYNIIKRLFDHIFEREEIKQAQLLKNFSLEVSKSLHLEGILESLVQVVQSGIKVEKVYVCMPDEKGKYYRTIYSSSPLDSKDFKLSVTNPCVKWLLDNNTSMLVKEFQRSVLFKAMWSDEKKQLSDLEIECFVPLICDEELAGILLLSRKVKNSTFTYDDINFLESINLIVSIAIKNARLYEKAYLEARTDDLTGLLNRKYFYEAINEEFIKNQKGSLVLLILNIDDFKLYNQLYGNQEGDTALINVARIIKTCVGSNGITARYSGKEFAVILPSYDVLTATILTEEIRKQVYNMNKGDLGDVLKILTFSAGICSYPYAASNVKQLMENADMAVFNAKRSGKNKVEVYSLKEPAINKQEIETPSKPNVYTEYASTIYALTATIDTKDHYTFKHSQKVAEYATILSNAIGLNQEHVEMIREAALLHDIGKIGIPENILNKNGILTDEEFQLMKKHVENSISIIRHLPSLDYVIPGVIGHHERWDGKGYPRGIAGEDIPLSARCLALADAFDAMTTERSYKKALPIEFAVKEIEKYAGLQFDPKLAKEFVRLVETKQIVV